MDRGMAMGPNVETSSDGRLTYIWYDAPGGERRIIALETKHITNLIKELEKVKATWPKIAV